VPNFHIAEDFPNPKCTMGVTTWFTPGIVDKLIVNADNWTNGTLPTSDLTRNHGSEVAKTMLNSTMRLGRNIYGSCSERVVKDFIFGGSFCIDFE
jgi:hypothetical protein